jgi:hypothetical protein
MRSPYQIQNEVGTPIGMVPWPDVRFLMALALDVGG